MQNKKLFVDARWIAQPGQGVYTYFHEIYSRLIDRKVPGLKLIFGVLPGKLPDFSIADSLIIDYESDSFLWRQLSLGRVLNETSPDFVHFQYVLPYGLNDGIHKILSLHDVIFLEYPEYFSFGHRLSRKIFYKSSAKRADTLLTISRKSAIDIENFLGIDPNRIKIIPLGAGSRLHALDSKSVPTLADTKFILSVGRHEPRKNYSRLTSAFASSGLFEYHGVRLVIAGWIAEEFKKSIGEAAPGVLMLTDCDDEQLVWLYQNACGFVFPSIAEGYGLPLVEAMEFALPSIASNTYPIDEVRALCFSTFDPFSVEEIRNALVRMLDAGEGYAVSSKGIPTWDDYVDKFLKVLGFDI
jgi:glycosyltransferase involved in cell wall biosynthesis